MNENDIKANAKNAIIGLSFIIIICIIIFLCIAVFDKNISDVVLFGGVFGLVIITCGFGIGKFYKQLKNPQNFVPKANTGNIFKNKTNNLLYNAEYAWDVAEANYCAQYNKNRTELNEKDKEIIWKYCCSEVSFYIAWLVDNNFLTLDQIVSEDVNNVKNRKMRPDELFENIDMKLSEDDVSDEILPFIEYCINDGFESIDKFIFETSKKRANIYTNKYNENERIRFGFMFEWDDYDAFKEILDEEYKNFLNE